MKIRLGGVMAGKAAQKLGINITTVAASELYESLQRGVIDGGEFSTPCSDDSLKLQEVAKYWCSPAWYQSGGVNGVMINKDAWNKLPEEYQNAIQMAAEICTSEQLSRYLWMDFDSTKKMLEEDGCVVTKMNQDDWNTIRETCRQVYEEEAAKNENFNMVYKALCRITVNMPIPTAQCSVTTAGASTTMNPKSDRQSVPCSLLRARSLRR